MATPTAIVAYLLLFAGAAVSFLFINLLVGKLLRPSLPNQEKQEIYECGEPTIGSSFVQFDLRFYVVALLFIIFDVEVAFFFPWATVYGKVTQLSAQKMPALAVDSDPAHGSSTALSPQAAERYRELGVPFPAIEPLTVEQAKRLGLGSEPAERARGAVRDNAQKLATMSLWDIGAFFAVLMVGFAYVWKRGDLEWVRGMRSHGEPQAIRRPVTLELEQRVGRPTGSILSA